MSKIQQLLNKKEKYEFPEYSKEELKELEKELENYKITKNIKGKDYIFYNDESYLKDIGALNRNGDVVIINYQTRYNSKGEPYAWCDYPTKYELIREKIEQLYKLIGKREYAQKINDKELDKELLSLVDTIGIQNETELVDF